MCCTLYVHTYSNSSTNLQQLAREMEIQSAPRCHDPGSSSKSGFVHSVDFVYSGSERSGSECSERSERNSRASRPRPVRPVSATSAEIFSKRSSERYEKYALFTSEEIFSSVNLRRLDAIAVEMLFEDAYALLTPDWYLDRRDVNQPHSSEWPFFSPDFWCSSDSGKVCFLPVSDALAELVLPGQYHKAVGEDWRCYDALGRPGNVGGFHGCCVDTGQPGSDWTLVARLADFGWVLDRAAGIRVEFAALVRNDSENLVASLGAHDECRALFRVADVRLPTGKLLLLDPADVNEFGGWRLPDRNASLDLLVEDGPAVPTGLGAGYYPVVLSSDSSQSVCRISMAFHPTRASKIPKTFPPCLQPGQSRPPIPRPKEGRG